MKKKSFVALLLAVVMAVVAMFTLAGCGDPEEPKTTDTAFEGVASTETYETQNDAAQDYIAVEISGKATTATYESYEKSGDNLTAEQIAELNLGEINAEDVLEAENGIITYYDSDVKKTVKIIIFKTADGYHYYTPVLKNGDTLTKGYLDLMLDAAKYRNMTEYNTTTTKVTAQGQSSSAVSTAITKISETAMSTQIKSGSNVMMEIYIAPGEDNLIVYQKTTGSWQKNDMTQYKTVDDFIDALFVFDWSYFVKTPYGFKLDSDKATKYANDVLDSALRQIKIVYSASITGMSAGYYVVDGCLDHIDVKVTLKGSYSGIPVDITVTGKTTYSYGTTVVDEPEGLPA